MFLPTSWLFYNICSNFLTFSYRLVRAMRSRSCPPLSARSITVRTAKTTIAAPQLCVRCIYAIRPSALSSSPSFRALVAHFLVQLFVYLDTHTTRRMPPLISFLAHNSFSCTRTKRFVLLFLSAAALRLYIASTWRITVGVCVVDAKQRK